MGCFRINNPTHFYSPILKNFGEIVQLTEKKYRFAFNGKEVDNDIYGEGNAYDFGARIYDGRLGRWMSCDPLEAKFAGLSPFNYCQNSPIIFLDRDGRELQIGGIVYIPPQLRTADDIKRINASNNKDIYAAVDILYTKSQIVGDDRLNRIINSKVLVQIKTTTAIGGGATNTRISWKDSPEGESIGVGSGYIGETVLNQVVTINFNPNEGLEFPLGSSSSAVGLAHELDHASQAVKIIEHASISNSYSEYEKEAMDYAFGGEEERAVGSNSLERMMADALGQYSRETYAEENKSLVRFVATESIFSTKECSSNTVECDKAKNNAKSATTTYKKNNGTANKTKGD